MANLAALNTVYNHFMTTYAPEGTNSKYDTHKKSELRGVYSSIVKMNREAPLFLLDTSDEAKEFAVSLKEGARSLKNVISSVSANSGEELLAKKSVSSSDESVVTATYIGDVSDGSEVPSLDIEVKNLANGQTSSEFIEELLDERVRELGLTNARWFDMIRYKRTDWMTKQLHGIMQIRMMQSGTVFVSRHNAWIGADYDNDPSSTQPLDFYNTIKTITGNSRYLWTKNPTELEVKKWLLEPIPLAEINKKYGLVQNPGWE